jgi:hypothetical protein
MNTGGALWSEPNTCYRDTLTRLTVLGTLSRDAGEGLQDVRSQTLSCTAGEGNPARRAGRVRVYDRNHPFDFDG